MISAGKNFAEVATKQINRSRLLATAASPKPWTDIPGLTSYPYLGALPHFLPYIGSIGPITTTYDLLDKLYKRYGGPIARLGKFFARNPMIVIYEPELMEQVLRNENVEPNRDGFKTIDYFRQELHKDVFEGALGLVSAQGAEWKAFRSKVNQPMLQPHVIKLYKNSIDQVTEEMMDRIKRLRKEPEYLINNMDFEMTRWSLETISVIALGKPIGCLRDDLPEDDPARQLLKSVRDIFLLTYKVEMGPPIWKYYKTANFKKLMKALETHMSVSQMYINEAVEKINKRTDPIAPEDKSILEKFLEVDKRVAVVMAIDMLAAGVDTVASQMIAILYLLAKNPDKQTKLRDAVRSNDLSYVKAVIKEAMRLRPIVGTNVRGTTKEHIVGEYLLPKGIDIIFPHEYLCLQDRYYPRAKEFIPERYLVEKSDPLHYGNTHPMVSLPFGFGVRSCIGRRIAELEMESFLIKFVDRFEVHWCGDPIKVVTRSLNMYLKPFNFVISNAPQTFIP